MISFIHSLHSTLHCWRLGTDKFFHPLDHDIGYYLSMFGLSLIYGSKKNAWGLISTTIAISMLRIDEKYYWALLLSHTNLTRNDIWAFAWKISTNWSFVDLRNLKKYKDNMFYQDNSVMFRHIGQLKNVMNTDTFSMWLCQSVWFQYFGLLTRNKQQVCLLQSQFSDGNT